MTGKRQISDPRIADLVQAGKVRVALYVPNYVKDPDTGELHGWAPDVVRALGAHFGIVGVPLEHPHPPAAMASLKSGAADAAILGIVASRAAEVDYTAPLVEADYTILAPAGSPYRSLADADRPGVRIAAVRNHASTMALAQIVKHATFLCAEMPDPTFAILRSGNADLFASLRQVLLQYSAQLPGSRLFDGRYGFNSIGIAVPKGMPGRLAAMNEFAEEAKSSGLVRRAIYSSGWSGIQVAPRNTAAVIQ
jgi:polar amino acid transport system substrate-binding protein